MTPELTTHRFLRHLWFLHLEFFGDDNDSVRFVADGHIQGNVFP